MPPKQFRNYFTMGINDILPHLPGGHVYHHSFFNLDWEWELGVKEKIVPLDAGGVLWQMAANHAYDYLQGNYHPSLTELAHFLLYLRSICGWKLKVFMDGFNNDHKNPENERRDFNIQKAINRHDLRGQIKNSPEYITAAIRVCRHLHIDVMGSYEEADPQVAHAAQENNLIPVTGDSDLLAYGVGSLGKVIIVKGCSCLCA